MLASMSAPKKTSSTKTRATKPARSTPLPPIEPTRADGRAKSALAMERERAALEAGRALLLRTLREQDWNLSATARALGLPGASHVIRAIRDHALETEYEAARDEGKISHATRT